MKIRLALVIGFSFGLILGALATQAKESLAKYYGYNGPAVRCIGLPGSF